MNTEKDQIRNVPSRLDKCATAQLTAEQLKSISPNISDKAIGLFLPYLNKYMPQYGIDTPQRISAFLAQIIHESGGFKYVREIWGPTLQQRKYERDFKEYWPEKPSDKKPAPTQRNYVAYNLGNCYAGDGQHFKGHGLIQITGRDNHKRCSIALFGDDRLLANPELLTIPEYAVQSACWYIPWRGLLDELDTIGVEDERRKINGGLLGLKEIIALSNRAILVLNSA
jgi:putative chitinase